MGWTRDARREQPVRREQGAQGLHQRIQAVLVTIARERIVRLPAESELPDYYLRATSTPGHGVPFKHTPAHLSSGVFGKHAMT